MGLFEMDFWTEILRGCMRGQWRRRWHPTPVLLPGESHGRRSMVGYSPWGLEESDTTERLHFHFSLSCIGEENGNPLQCSCLENPRHGRAWWAAVYVGSHRVGHDWSDLAAAVAWGGSRKAERWKGWSVTWVISGRARRLLWLGWIWVGMDEPWDVGLREVAGRVKGIPLFL